MPRKPAASTRFDHVDILMMAAWGLAAGSKARRADESPEDFVDRIIAELPGTLVQAEGHIPVVAAVFDVDPGLLDDLISQVEEYPELRLAYNQGRAVAESNRKQSAETSIAIKEFTLRQMQGAEKKVKRTRRWPDDPAERQKQILKVMPQAIEDYQGKTEAMSKPLKLSPREIQAVIDSDPALTEKQEIERAQAAFLSLQNLERLAATADSPAAAIRILEILYPEKYNTKQQIEVTNKGFEPPPADHAPRNILFAKKEQDKCDEE